MFAGVGLSRLAGPGELGLCLINLCRPSTDQIESKGKGAVVDLRILFSPIGVECNCKQ